MISIEKIKNQITSTIIKKLQNLEIEDRRNISPTLWEKIKLNIHLIYCRACRKYSKNNATLTETIKKSDVECLDKKCKEAMKKNFNKALKKASN